MSMTDGAGAPADGGTSTPVDAGSGDTSFALNDAIMDNDFETIELPAEDTPQPGDGTPGGQQPPQPGGTPTPQGQATPEGQAAPKPGTPPAGQQPPQAQPTPAQPVQPQGSTGTETAAPRGPLGPGELATALGQNREMIINALATQKFQLTPAEIQALEVDAVGVLPKIMARVYYEATVNGLQQMANLVPRMVAHVANEQIVENAAEADFHNEWSNIDRNNPQHMRAVQHFAQSFRQLNPNASKADAIKFVGTAVTNYFGLQGPQRAAGQPQRGTSPPARRSAPAFTPAQGGRAQPPAAGTVPAGQGDPFGGLGMEFDG